MIQKRTQLPGLEHDLIDHSILAVDTKRVIKSDLIRKGAPLWSTPFGALPPESRITVSRGLRSPSRSGDRLCRPCGRPVENFGGESRAA